MKSTANSLVISPVNIPPLLFFDLLSFQKFVVSSDKMMNIYSPLCTLFWMGIQSVVDHVVSVGYDVGEIIWKVSFLYHEWCFSLLV